MLQLEVQFLPAVERASADFSPVSIVRLGWSQQSVRLEVIL